MRWTYVPRVSRGWAPSNATFQYDPLGRRTKKVTSGTTTRFHYDGVNPVQELDNSGNIFANVLTGLGIDEYFTRSGSPGTRTLLGDALNSTLALTDDTGTVQTTYTYEPFGTSSVTGQTNTNSYQYTARENDGTGLDYYRARYYYPSRQRFISEDPIEFAGGDVNLYAYVKSSPLNYRDPSGLWIAQVIGGGLGAAFGGYAAYANNPNASWGTIAQSAAVGAAAGVLSTLPIPGVNPLLSGLLVGSIAGAAGNLGSQLLFPACPGSIDVGSALIAAATGGLGGGAGAAVAGIASRQGAPIFTKLGQDIFGSSTSGIVAGVADAIAQSQYQAAKTSGRKPQACQ